MYQSYCNNYDQAMVVLNQHAEKQSFQILTMEIRDKCNGKTLQSLLMYVFVTKSVTFSALWMAVIATDCQFKDYRVTNYVCLRLSKIQKFMGLRGILIQIIQSTIWM